MTQLNFKKKSQLYHSKELNGLTIWGYSCIDFSMKNFPNQIQKVCSMKNFHNYQMYRKNKKSFKKNSFSFGKVSSVYSFSIWMYNEKWTNQRNTEKIWKKWGLNNLKFQSDIPVFKNLRNEEKFFMM